MSSVILTQATLKSLLHYDPKTGIFIWINPNKYHNELKGKIAGCKNDKGYIIIRINKKGYGAHRLAYLYMSGSFPPYETDHENHIRDDNRWFNLEAATPHENSKNRTIRSDNTTGCVGVYWREKYNRWYARIMDDGNPIHIGVFTDYFEAVCARKSAENRYDFHENHGMVPASGFDHEGV